MPLPELLETLERDVTAQIDAMLAQARADAERIDAETAAMRAQRIETAAAEHARVCRERAERSLAEAVHLARATTLRERAAMLDRLRERIRERLPALLVEQAATLGPALVAAVLEVADRTGVLRCPPVLEALARAVVPPELAIEIDPAVATGVVLVLDPGLPSEVEVEASLDALLAREWPRLASEALAIVGKDAAS